GQQTHVEVPCPAGTKVVGGGAYGSDADVGAQSINSTYPRQDRRKYFWEINMNNADSTDQTGIAIAVCGSAAGYLLKHKRMVSYAGEDTLIIQRCGRLGTQVPLGGGIQASSTSTSDYFIMDGPETRGGVPYRWWTDEYNGSSEDATSTGWI